ncbi:hypothetical protein ISF_08664 [Cordyceps fumosorosea ARSEF 2679]|uniref:Uncharacterized protein n=1 Tax=Cordyceps fumosorosea (strain ARSEF 2679) TaxID=1081104 RepID=A0A162I8H9_CORFA|nr:hypothetical protein ISF_08664 [Cordyceps fumosorosea ARSEF 2679]OAA53725.1 hypothetical protein ISF_08664 [Cordyceps fumosorosea ARSEF 2679]
MDPSLQTFDFAAEFARMEGYEYLELPNENSYAPVSPEILWLGDAAVITRRPDLAPFPDTPSNSTRRMMEMLLWQEIRVFDMNPGTPVVRDRRFWIRTFDGLSVPQSQRLMGKHRLYASQLWAQGRLAAPGSSDMDSLLETPGGFMVATGDPMLVSRSSTVRKRCRPGGIAIGDVVRVDDDGHGAETLLAALWRGLREGDNEADWARRKMVWRETLQRDVRALHAANATWGAVRLDGVMVQDDRLWIFHFGVGPWAVSSELGRGFLEFDEDQYLDILELAALLQHPLWE